MGTSNISEVPLVNAPGLASGVPSKSLRARFAKDVFVFGWANVVSLLLNGTLTFLLPRYLLIEDFGYYRLFVLYSSLAGMLHLGFLEGILVRWADKPGERIESEINSVLAFLVLEHFLILAAPCLVLIVWFHTPQYLWLGLGIAAFYVVFNCSMVGQIALQTRKQFRELAFFTVMTAALLLVFVVALNVLGKLNSSTAIISYIAANLIAGIGIWKAALQPGSAPVRPLRAIRKLGFDNIHLGWKILVANLLLTVIPNLDRFVVSGAFSIQDFAIYAFAGNALAVVYAVAISVARVVYPYLSEGTSWESRRRAYNLGQATVLSLWALSLVLYFPTAFVVHWIVPKYASSLPIVRLLMVNSGFVCMIHILHANYFRVNLALNRFLAASVIGVVAAAFLLTLARRTTNMQWIAAAMGLAIVFWWATNEILLSPHLGGSWTDRLRMLLLWFLSSGAFLAASALQSLWFGAFVYAVACVLIVGVGLSKTIAPIFTRGFRFSSL